MPCPEPYQCVMEADLLFRPLVPEDITAVLDIELQGYSYPWSEAVFLDCFKDSYRFWAACQGESLVGYAVVTYVVGEAHLLNICMHPRVRGKGVGRQLLRHVLAAASHEGMSQLLLEVRASNKAAIALYEDEGFREIGRRPGYYPSANGREDARVMVLGLGQ
ncbi:MULTISPECIES: ribosomal protein S18-alanine N-acetyltransferase [Marinobacter]|uniref:[Ribosomal protein bS18]-alanine N-acetyltransferase n=1 Tax=Marinobacter metalliresistant TaxID=2961995 RepID=A0ABZ2W0G0_9GAMM|nr:ribosomal protein S18-alanine N-acetyltransferase [Marinobacter sp. Arc7-DN-1]AXS84482.1 ribosomal-protein-alanine N-acetyltransferase [Marinobacter sp. Arc7-DN-1]